MALQKLDFQALTHFNTLIVYASLDNTTIQKHFLVFVTLSVSAAAVALTYLHCWVGRCAELVWTRWLALARHKVTVKLDTDMMCTWYHI